MTRMIGSAWNARMKSAAGHWQPVAIDRKIRVVHGVINNNGSGARPALRKPGSRPTHVFPDMSSLMPVGAGDLLRHPAFLSFLLSRSLSRFASQIGAVA